MAQKGQSQAHILTQQQKLGGFRNSADGEDSGLAGQQSGGLDVLHVLQLLLNAATVAAAVVVSPRHHLGR